MSRRRFFKRSGIVLGGTFVGLYLAKSPLRSKMFQIAETIDVPSGIIEFDPQFWFSMQPDSTIDMHMGKIDMGQGIYTGFVQLAAEELHLDYKKINPKPIKFSQGPVDYFGTGGSSSTASLYKPIREVAATMREILKIAAAKKWQVDPQSLKVEDGFFISKDRRLSYYEVSQMTQEWEMPITPVLKKVKEFQFVGKRLPGIDIEQKVTGRPLYAIDQQIDNMIYATAKYSPKIGGKLDSFDVSLSEKVEGFIKVVQGDNWIATVGSTRYSAIKSMAALRTNWTADKAWQQKEIEALIQVENAISHIKAQSEGSYNLFDIDSESFYEAEYKTPLAVHAQIEPNSSIVQIMGDKVKVWTGTQNIQLVVSEISKHTHFSRGNIEVQTHYLGGGFGGKFLMTNAVEAVQICQDVGRPVQLLRMREEEFINRYFRPLTKHYLRAQVDTIKQKIIAIEHQSIGADMMLSKTIGALPARLVGADIVAMGHGAGVLYEVENKFSTIYNCKLPFPVGIWRGVGQFQNSFAIESFVNELAHNYSIDPFILRTNHLNPENPIHKRCLKVLEVLHNKGQWNQSLKAGLGRGIAIIEDRKTISAALIEVELIDNKPVVNRVIQVIDAGLVINPVGVESQVEGATMMALSASLYEKTYVENGEFQVSNYHLYPMVRLIDLPAKIEVHILNSGVEPFGVGEPPLAPVAPALAAALNQVTDKIIREIPFVDSISS